MGHELKARARATALAAALTAVGACNSGEASPTNQVPDGLAAAPPATSASCVAAPRLAPPQRHLEGAADGAQDLLRRVESALTAADGEALTRLLITEREYRELLYPSFPAAYPPIDASFETVWILHIGDTTRGLHQALRLYGGKDVRLQNLRFEQPDQDCVNFVLDERSAVDVTVEGELRRAVELFGSVIRVGDQAKILSFPD